MSVFQPPRCAFSITHGELCLLGANQTISFPAWACHELTKCVVAGKEVDVIDGKNLRRLALAYKVPIITTVAGAKATTSALAGMQKGPLHQVPLQDYFPEAAERSTVEFKIVG